MNLRYLTTEGIDLLIFWLRAQSVVVELSAGATFETL